MVLMFMACICSNAIERSFYKNYFASTNYFEIVHKNALIEDNKYIQRKYFGKTNDIAPNITTNQYFIEFRYIESGIITNRYHLIPASVNSRLSVIDSKFERSPKYCAILYATSQDKIFIYETKGDIDKYGDMIFTDKLIPVKFDLFFETINGRINIRNQKVTDIEISISNRDKMLFHEINGKYYKKE
jgi:hypothetical protein